MYASKIICLHTYTYCFSLLGTLERASEETNLALIAGFDPYALFSDVLT